ncbi:TetR family transcriptional regulator [Paraburkholderia rhizosphaerae]|uniref:TetR family transcriptional regulator n=2 Tax=Paraburkholderia rhizosphaerae TaxID=480658 RepID=A0A4R8LXA5_9BURK|nr:TetR family transcriptional regulator [Paraburkholderia rhizosphaerae]
MGRREDIIEATKDLLWEKGYEATSPRDIQAKSKAGQGSFYHHFTSKQALAREAIVEVVEERIADFEEAMSRQGRFKDRLLAYFEQNTRPLSGCRVGRLVWDAAIQDDELRQPLSHYFGHIETRLQEILKGEQSAGSFRLKLPAAHIALTIVTVVQGSFAVSRAMNRSRAHDARTALLACLDLAIIERTDPRTAQAASCNH